MSQQAKSLTEVFFDNLLILGDDDCWEYQGSQRGGSAKVGRYGQVSGDGTIKYAHRLAYEIYNGPIPKGLMVLHASKCTTRLCCNPAHLRLGNATDNQRQRVLDGTAPRGQQSGRSKLTNLQVKKIRALAAEGELEQKDIAVKFNISQSTVAQIVLRRTWKHLP